MAHYQHYQYSMPLTSLFLHPILGRTDLNSIVKEREERAKRIREEQEAERRRKAEEWKQHVCF